MILSSFVIKIIAIISMTLDHTIKVLGKDISIPLEIWALGRIAFPLFAFLLVEGANHTKNMIKYVTRIGVLAIFSEFIYDLTLHNSLLEFNGQNVLFELFLGLLILWLYKYLEGKGKREFIIFPFVFAGFIAEICKFDYGVVGLLCIFFLYIASEKNGWLRYVMYFIAICMTLLNVSNQALLVLQSYSLLALVPISLYNGKSGYKFNKYLFYVFYPTHLYILYLLKINLK